MIIKKKYTEILTKISPGPIGQGLTVAEAVKDLNLSINTIRTRLKQFKKKYPDAWDKFKKLRSIARKDRLKLQWKRRLGEGEKVSFPNQIGLNTFTELESDTFIVNDLEETI